MGKKVIVFHPMQQHSYKTAEALTEGGFLYEYWTSIYYQPDKLVYKILTKILDSQNIKRMMGRQSDSISPYVRTGAEVLGFLYLLVARIDKKGNATSWLQYALSMCLGKKVAHRAMKEKVDIIVSYDTWSYGVIRELKKYQCNIKVVVDYSSLYAEKIVGILHKDMEQNPKQGKSRDKIPKHYASKYIEKYRYEKNYADYFFSASTVTDKSLMEFGVHQDSIFRCCYGTYFKKTPYVDKQIDSITFVYVGRMSYAKGVHHLIKAFSSIKRVDFKLLLVGADVDGLVQNIRSSNIQYMGCVLHDEIPKILEQAHVVITASLYDGFSFSLLEAASHNLPIICTESTGLKDYIVDGVNGFVIKCFDSEEIKEKVIYLLDNKFVVKQMAMKVGEIVEYLTWDNYNEQVIRSIKRMH